MFSVVDFFCGAGGFSLGFQQAGFEVVGAYDFDRYACKSYSKNVSDVVEERDVGELEWFEIQKADVWSFSFPCQDLSLSGKKAGIYGNRSNNFFQIMRLLHETRENKPENLPKVIVAENVEGLKQYLPIVKKEYANVGYKYYVIIYNAKFWNVPQNRVRYFVVGVRDDLKYKFKFKKEVEPETLPKLIDILEENPDRKMYIDDKKASEVLQLAIEKYGLDVDLQQIFLDKDECSYCLDANYYKGFSPKQFDKSKRTHIVTGTYGGRDGFMVKDISNALDSNYHKGIGCGQSRPAVAEIHPELRIRKFSVRECARLQAFPDTYKFPVSNMQAYKQLGNAVTVTVGQAVAESILDFFITNELNSVDDK